MFCFQAITYKHLSVMPDTVMLCLLYCSSCCHIFPLTTCSLTRRLHILLRLSGADHGWNGRGGQACETSGPKDRCQLMCRPPVVGLCVCPALNREGTLCGHWSTDVYSTAGRLFSCWNSGLDFVLSWLWRLIVRFCCWLLTRRVLILIQFACQWRGIIHWSYMLHKRPRL